MHASMYISGALLESQSPVPGTTSPPCRLPSDVRDLARVGPGRPRPPRVHGASRSHQTAAAAQQTLAREGPLRLSIRETDDILWIRAM